MPCIIESVCDDVLRNLAVEEFLFDHAAEFAPALFLCRNRAAVVVGKNQNPWRECRVELLAEEGITLARRISGGGAVFHDAGNLNYGVVLPRAAYRADNVFDFVIAALDRLGLQVSRTARTAPNATATSTSLFLDGFKVSGNAFALRGQFALHHGTLLVRSDLNRLRHLFPGTIAVADTHAVPSIPAPVANLSHFRPDLTPDAVAAALRDEFERRYGAARRISDAEVEAWNWRAAADRHAMREWVFGRTPPFTTVAGDGSSLRVAEGYVRQVTGGAPAEWIGRFYADIHADWLAYCAARGVSKT